MENHNKQAEKFLESTSTTIKIVKSKKQTAPLWAEDKLPDMYGIKYSITLKRNGERYNFNFWDCIANRKENKEPNAYDVLVCITKHDPETLEDFCSMFGYEIKKKKTMTTYKAVVKEWENVNRLFVDVLEELRDIQ